MVIAREEDNRKPRGLRAGETEEKNAFSVGNCLRWRGMTRMSIAGPLGEGATLDGVRLEMGYEVYDGFAAVRKWVKVRNGGTRWLRMDRMVIEAAGAGAVSECSRAW